MIGIRFDLPFQEQLDFFRQKGFELSPDSWRDVWKDAHARAFTVARVGAMDVLEDIRKAVDTAMERGQSLKVFKANIRPLLEKKGWFAPKGEQAKVLLPDGTIRKRLTGWRLDNIFGTNCGAAYSVGRYKQQQEVKKARPYWMYIAVRDASTRPDHLKMNGGVWHADHPVWNEWYPPNGFRCRCYVRTLSEREMKRLGLIEEKKGVDVLPDEGFEYNPGKAGLAAWKPDLMKFPEPVRALVEEAIAQEFVPAKTIKEAEAWALEKDLADVVDYKGIDVEVANEWNESLFDHLKRYPKLRENMEFVGTTQARNRYLKDKILVPKYKKSITGENIADTEAERLAKRRAERTASRWGFNKTSSNVYAQASSLEGVKGITVNKKWGKDASVLKRALSRDVKNRFHPEGTENIRSIVDHEIGHQLDFLCDLSKNRAFRAFYDQEIENGLKYFENNLSRYAYRGGTMEFIAEGWAEYLNNPTPRRLAREIGTKIEEAYDAIR